jgi:hypothetical protein
VADEFSPHELALRKLPLPYSLALRLRDAGIAREVICEYVDVEEAALDQFYRVAEAKLVAIRQRRSTLEDECGCVAARDAYRPASQATSSQFGVQR